MNILTTAIWVVSLTITVAWYFSQIHRGRLLTLQSVIVLQFFFLPILIQYPFATMPENITTIGEAGYQLTLRGFDTAFLVTIWGMAWFSMPFISHVNSPTVQHIADWTADSMATGTSTKILLFLLAIGVGLSTVIFHEDPTASFTSGGLRGAVMLHHYLDPPLLVLVAIIPMVAALSLFRAITSNTLTTRVIMVTVFFIASGVGLLTSTRTTALLGLFIVVSAIIISKSHARTIGRPWLAVVSLIIPAIIFLVFIFSIASIRNGGSFIGSILGVFGDGNNSLYFHMFYGNTFSDLRDFSRVIGGWNGHYLFGKTLLSGVLAFLPHAILPEKESWTWSAVTSPMAGIYIHNFPGLRPSIFGEWYMNFSLPGVAIEAFALGVFTRSLDVYLKRAAMALKTSPSHLQQNQYLFKALTAITLLEMSINACLSDGSVQTYLFIALLMLFKVLQKRLHEPMLQRNRALL